MPAPTDSRRRLSEHIADELQLEIVRDGFRAGTRLPTEPALMERFDVSRTVVREAAQLLLQRGLVTVSPGRGMLVAEYDGAQLAEQFELLMQASGGSTAQLLAVRTSLLVEAATEAARNATGQAISALDAVLAQRRAALEAGADDDHAVFESEVRFMDLVVEASGNVVLRILTTPLTTFVRTHMPRRARTTEEAERTLREHAALLDALRRRDTFDARRAATVHLERVSADRSV